ncbi:hypothetical protein OH76DRAFT_161198 [Lentinus brumalis]|uniref:Uncharacterized protein n=1 Tax=Lentinus brumalis TaxID=2498619 RepID=A0A371DJ04_9APHY|nr:hypothetical protein OH76DRAFT_161198 [Polyporus brumalis]
MTTMLQPLGKRFLMRKSSNAENAPPSASAYHKKADALVSAREASRRRRARVVSGSMPLKAKKLLLNAQRRVSKAQHAAKLPKVAIQASEPVELVNQEQSQTATAAAPLPQPAPDAWRFPRALRRPPPPVWPMQLRRENVDACDPALVGVPMDYIMRGLEAAGDSMWHLVRNAEVDGSSLGHRTGLPDEINVIIADHTRMHAKSALPSSNPTHVLAIWDLPFAHAVYKNGTGRVDPATGRRKISLMPAHNLVLAAHCAKWFPLPKAAGGAHETRVEDQDGVPGTQLTLPVVPLAVPHPQSFMLLLQTLYTHKVSWLLDQLVPVPKPTVVFPTRETPQPRNPHYIVETGRRVAARFTPHAIVGMLGMVIGLWQNAIYLGVSDRRLWIGIDWSYDMLLTGLAMSLGRPEMVPRPAPVQWPVAAKA